jgi:hypothetical protein
MESLGSISRLCHLLTEHFGLGLYLSLDLETSCIKGDNINTFVIGP